MGRPGRRRELAGCSKNDEAGGLDTWLMDDDLIDVEGTQADDSRELVRHLTALLPVDPTPKLSSIA